MVRGKKWLAAYGMAAVLFVGCSIFDGGDGVCVSAPVQYSFGLRVYCYGNFSKGECSDYNSQQVNNAAWAFHAGQTCGDRNLQDGSNAYS